MREGGLSAITYREARIDELGDVLRVQHEAFRRLADDLGIDPSGMPPLLEDLDQLAELHASGVRFVVACQDSRIIGGVRGRLRGGTVEVGRLVVDGDHLRRGIATKLMLALEELFADARNFKLFTGQDAIAPLALYEKLGYVVTKRRVVESVPLVWLEKRRTGGDHRSPGHVS